MKNQPSYYDTVPVSADRQGALFDVDAFRPDEVPPPEVLPRGTPQLRRANRRQVEFRASVCGTICCRTAIRRVSSGISSRGWISRRCGERGEVPFQWICCCVSVNYHTLSDFRTQHAECVNAVARNRGLRQFNVRGLVKDKAVILWYAIVGSSCISMVDSLSIAGPGKASA